MPAVEPVSLEAVPPLALREFEQIRLLAYRAFGLDLKAGKEELVNARLRRLVRDGGFRSFQQYYHSVLDDRSGGALASMIDALATNHTSFLRERDHFDFLAARAADLARHREVLDVWSAACSTGEEAWTLASILDETLPNSGTHIWATDISNKALRAAARAEYPASQCRQLPATWLARYFEAQGRPAERYRVSAALRARVSFRRLNLVRQLQWPRPFPVIFCRNVMIYFDQATQEQVVGQLVECLEPGGYLFVGHAESLARISHGLEYVQPAIYQKPATKGGRCRQS
jgi:chemotaxis protein methyltransferase CheR